MLYLLIYYFVNRQIKPYLLSCYFHKVSLTVCLIKVYICKMFTLSIPSIPYHHHQNDRGHPSDRKEDGRIPTVVPLHLHCPVECTSPRYQDECYICIHFTDLLNCNFTTRLWNYFRWAAYFSVRTFLIRLHGTLMLQKLYIKSSTRYTL